MTAPRLHVLTAINSDRAVVLRRGPSDQVASILWDRKKDTIELGQWLNGRIHEYRSDISPDGKYLVYFAGRGGRCWTAVSRAPWLRAISYWPQSHSWHGGGAFTEIGALWLNGAEAPAEMQDGLRPAATDAFSHSTDGFHMGGLVAEKMRLRGWTHDCGDRYETILRKPVSSGWALQCGFRIGEKNRALVSSNYALIGPGTDAVVDLPGWEWADLWQGEIQWAEKGVLWQARLADDGDLEDRVQKYDFTDMTYDAIKAPYKGVQGSPET